MASQGTNGFIPLCPSVQKIFVVTRQKSNARYRVLERRSINAALGLVSDETILLTGAKARECPKPLRRIVYQVPETGKVYVFLINHFRNNQLCLSLA